MSQSPVTAMLFALCSRLHDSKSEESLWPYRQEDRHTCLQGFPSIVQTIGGGKKPSSFSLPRSLTHWQCYLEKSYFPDCLCLRSTLAFIPQALTSTLQLLNRSRSQLLNKLLHSARYKAATGFVRSSFKDRHTYLPASPDIGLVPTEHEKSSLFSLSPHTLPSMMQDIFTWSFERNCCICTGTFSGHCDVFTRRDFLPFQTDFFCQSSDRSFHTWSSIFVRRSLYCPSSGPIKVSIQAPCAFISPRETHSATKCKMLSILQLEHTAPKTTGLHLHPVSRIWLSWLIRHTPLVHFTHYFFKVFVQVQVLCVPALHHLP